jgi:hypothetical protein
MGPNPDFLFPDQLPRLKKQVHIVRNALHNTIFPMFMFAPKINWIECNLFHFAHCWMHFRTYCTYICTVLHCFIWILFSELHIHIDFIFHRILSFVLTGLIHFFITSSSALLIGFIFSLADVFYSLSLSYSQVLSTELLFFTDYVLFHSLVVFLFINPMVPTGILICSNECALSLNSLTTF